MGTSWSAAAHSGAETSAPRMPSPAKTVAIFILSYLQKKGGWEISPAPLALIIFYRVLIDVIPGVIYVELAGRCNQPCIRDPGLFLEGLVVEHNDLALAIPHGNPQFVSGLVVLHMHNPALVGQLHDLGRRIEVLQVEYGYAPVDVLVLGKSMVNPEMVALRMCLEEQTAFACRTQLPDDLPGVRLKLAFRIGSDQSDKRLAEGR